MPLSGCNDTMFSLKWNIIFRKFTKVAEMPNNFETQAGGDSPDCKVYTMLLKKLVLT